LPPLPPIDEANRPLAVPGAVRRDDRPTQIGSRADGTWDLRRSIVINEMSLGDRPIAHLRSTLRVTSPASRSVGGSVALDTSHVNYGIPHDDQEFGQRSTHVVYVIPLVPTEVKAFELSVVRQPLYADQQRKPGVRTSSTAVVLQRRCCTLLGHFWDVPYLNSNIDACNNAQIQRTVCSARIRPVLVERPAPAALDHADWTAITRAGETPVRGQKPNGRRGSMPTPRDWLVRFSVQHR